MKKYNLQRTKINKSKNLLATESNDKNFKGIAQHMINNNNLEIGEEFAKKNNSNDEHSVKIKKAANKDNNVKKMEK